MAPDVSIVEATPEHALDLAPRIRPEDAAEVMASGGYSPIQALEMSMSISLISLTLLIDGKPAAMFGLAKSKLDEGVGFPWLLTTDLIAKHQKTFFGMCAPALAEMLEVFPTLVQLVDQRYAAALRWLERLGFERQAVVLFGQELRPFVPVILRRSHV